MTNGFELSASTIKSISASPSMSVATNDTAAQGPTVVESAAFVLNFVVRGCCGAFGWDRSSFADVLKQQDTAGFWSLGGEAARRFDAVGKLAQDQIEIAILIEVDPAATETDTFHLVESGRDRNFFESAIALVPKQMLFAGAGNHEIGKAVVVVVGGRSAEARAGSGKPGGGRYIGVGVVAIVAQEQIADLAVFDYRGKQEDVGATVVIVIEQNDCAAEALARRPLDRRQVGSRGPFHSGASDTLNPGAASNMGIGPIGWRPAVDKSRPITSAYFPCSL